MAPTNINPSLLKPLVGWSIVHLIAAAGMFGDTYGTPLAVGDMEYRWFFATIYLCAGLVPVASLLNERLQMVPVTPAHTMGIAFGLYVFLIGIQVGQLPIDDVRLLTGGWAAIGGGLCLIVFNRRLQLARNAQAKRDEDELVRRIAAAVRVELQR
ncbi:hypothetical protein [Mycetocola miduiensis]|uniref:Uncharacterized protein n=1 Tax=Mycetocola miduiensis TaxID=995034 RepID=A0A1I5AJ40_9MICO|nr:hypothetical protein [Mycetocola miduiensis]SFN62402.1 hypothetical protein SAMN05216219_1497 [Mycetocola miduiensis]